MIHLVRKLIDNTCDVCPILELLDIYVQNSNQTELNMIRGRINTVLHDDKNYIFVPRMEIYGIIQKWYPKDKIVLHPNPMMYETENRLLTLLKNRSHNDIYALKTVVFAPLEDDNYTTGNLTQILFVSEKYVASSKKWSENLMISSKSLLFPYNQADNEPYSKEADRMTVGKPAKNVRNAINVLLMTYHAYFDRLAFNELTLDVLGNYIGYFFEICDTEEQIVDVIRHFNNKIAGIVFNTSYGSNQTVLFAGSTLAIYAARYSRNNLIPHKLLRNLVYYVINLLLTSLGNIYHFPTIELFIRNMMAINVPLKYIDYISKNYHNESEVIVYLYMLTEICINDKKSIIEPEFILNEIRSRANPVNLHLMVRDSMLSLFGNTDIISKVMEPIIKTCSIVVEMDKKILNTVSSEISQVQYNFTAKSLIGFAFNYEIKPTWLQDAHMYHQQFKNDPVKLQVIEIAVNEGTTKEYTQSVLTELVQNSIDAIRSTPDSLKHHIDITIDGSITLSDTVGISPDRSDIFLALMIPFLSTKKVGDPHVTGEMGSGFFNVYRYPWCNHINIITCKDHMMTFIRATPIVDKERVMDINYEIYSQRKPSMENSTTIEIIFNKTLGKMLAPILANAHVFTRNYLSYCDVPIYLNGDKISNSKELVYSEKIGQVYVTGDRSSPSIVMTNSVPFQSLETLLDHIPVHYSFKHNNTTRIIVNFSKDIYKPVQSRTKIKFETVTDPELQAFISNGLYMALVYKYSRGELERPDNFILHSSSRESIYHLKLPDNMKYPSSIIDYDALGSVSDYIIPISENLKLIHIYNFNIYTRISPTISRYINHIIELIKSDSYEKPGDTGDFIQAAINRWFSWKSEEKPKIETAVVLKKEQVKKAKKSNQQNIAVQCDILQPFVDIYWNIVKELINSKVIGGVAKITLPPPRVAIGKSVQGYLGFYEKTNHTIIMDMKLSIIETELTQLKTSRKTETIRTNSVLASLFSSNTPTPTLIHELLHAILGDTHGDSAHPNVKFTINNKEHDLTFDNTAIEIYRSASEMNLFTQYFDT
jgi:hypothetical protein